MALQEEFQTQGNFLFRYRSYFPILFLIVSVLAFISEVNKNNSWIDCGQYWFISLGVGILGLFIRAITVGFTPKNTSGRNTAQGQVAEELNQTGIYSLVRHPLYLGNFFMWLGVAMLVGNPWFILAFTLAYWVYYERIMYAEEAFLRGKFGEAYLAWAENKPAFVPKFKMPLKPKYPFSLKKVLRKEKNGVSALFGLFWLFDLLRNSLQAGAFTFEKNFWFWAFVASMVFYLIFKFLKNSSFMQDGR